MLTRLVIAALIDDVVGAEQLVSPCIYISLGPFHGLESREDTELGGKSSPPASLYRFIRSAQCVSSL